MSVRTRLFHGTAATALGPLITALSQLLSVPILLRGWGPQLYGEWVVMNTIPSYLAISDLGFGTVAGNDMAIALASGDEQKALEIFQSTWTLVIIISALLLLAVLPAIFFCPLASLLHIEVATVSQLRSCLASLSIYAILTLQGSVLMSAFRSDGKYTIGALASNATRLGEGTAALLFAAAGYQPQAIALTYAVTRFLGIMTTYLVLRQQVKWLTFGITHASLRHIRELTKPAVAFMAFPIGNALSLQGMTLVLDLKLGTTAVALFSSMRTFSRLPYQIIDTIKNATWPELSLAFGAKNWPLARKLHRMSCMIALWLSLGSVGLLALAGPTFFTFWTRGRLTLDYDSWNLLLLVVIAASLWNTSSAVPIAANLHTELAARYLLGTSASLLAAFWLISAMGIPGAALALLTSDIWMSYFVVRQSTKLLGDDMRGFLVSMLDLSRLRHRQSS